jgi:hypothetical protein
MTDGILLNHSSKEIPIYAEILAEILGRVNLRNGYSDGITST